MTNSRNSRFQKGSAVYTCRICGKKTRETGNSESFCQLCLFCFEASGLENEYNDGCITKDEYNKQLAELKKEHNR